MPRARVRARTRRRVGTRRGGRLLDKGGYGCVFMPAIRCKGTQVALKNHISKVVDIQTANEEARSAKLLYTLDPNRQYTLYASQVCPIATDMTDEEHKENPITACSLFRPGETLGLVQIPYGGEGLHQFQPTAKQIPQFFESLQYVLEGVAFLHSKDLIHMDLKPANVLVGYSPSKKALTMRIIDFGLSFLVPQFSSLHRKAVYMSNYYVWPYETRFLDHSFNRWEITEDSVEMFHTQSLDQYMPTHIPPNVFYARNYRPRATVQMYREMYDMLGSLPTEDRIRTIGGATDVYSLGRMLATLWIQTTGHYPGSDDSVLFRNVEADGYHEHDEEDYWIPLLGEAEYQWNRMLAEDVSKPLFRMVADMMSPMLFNRPMAAQVLAAYRDILPAIATAFRAPQRVAAGISAVGKRGIPTPSPPPTPKAPPPTPAKNA